MLGPQQRGKFNPESETKDVTYLKLWKKMQLLGIVPHYLANLIFIYKMLGCGVSVLLLLFLLCGSIRHTKVISQVTLPSYMSYHKNMTLQKIDISKAPAIPCVILNMYSQCVPKILIKILVININEPRQQ